MGTIQERDTGYYSRAGSNRAFTVDDLISRFR